MSERLYLEIPGDTVFELPTLVVSNFFAPYAVNLNLVEQASELLPELDMAAGEVEQRLTSLQVFVTEAFAHMLHSWRLGDQIYSWVNISLETIRKEKQLCEFFQTGLWPHDHICRMVELVGEKNLVEKNRLEESLGLRLVYRKEPALPNFTSTALTLLQYQIFQKTYQQWQKSDFKKPLPPERFQFGIQETALFSDIESLA